MKTKFFRSVLVLLYFISFTAQSQESTLVFTALDSVYWVQLDSIKIINRSQNPGCDTTLYWPDTVLDLTNVVGLPEINIENSQMILFQNYPNPVTEKTTITLYIPEKDEVSIMIHDMAGRKLIGLSRVLNRGYHFFIFEPGGNNVCFLTARWKKTSAGIKILNASAGKHQPGKLTYSGSSDSSPNLKSELDTQTFTYSPGDTLLYVGHNDTLESGITDVYPEPGQVYTFKFSYNIPCPETPFVVYDKIYNTVQIFSQCWIKENLDVGTMIQAGLESGNNGIIEKFCYENNPINCIIYGGLYDWEELMQYSNNQGVQGICPTGWHIPTDEEWKILEGTVDSQYGIGHPIWDNRLARGYNAGANLKTTEGWQNDGNGTDIFGFSALPGGYYIMSSSFYEIGFLGSFWTSTTRGMMNAWGRYMESQQPNIERYDQNKEEGYSVRCLKDDYY